MPNIQANSTNVSAQMQSQGKFERKKEATRFLLLDRKVFPCAKIIFGS